MDSASIHSWKAIVQSRREVWLPTQSSLFKSDLLLEDGTTPSWRLWGLQGAICQLWGPFPRPVRPVREGVFRTSEHCDPWVARSWACSSIWSQMQKPWRRRRSMARTQRRRTMRWAVGWRGLGGTIPEAFLMISYGSHHWNVITHACRGLCQSNHSDFASSLSGVMCGDWWKCCLEWFELRLPLTQRSLSWLTKKKKRL